MLVDPPGDNDFFSFTLFMGKPHIASPDDELNQFYISIQADMKIYLVIACCLRYLTVEKRRQNFLFCMHFSISQSSLTFCLFFPRMKRYSLLSLSHCICLLVPSLYLPLFIFLSPPPSFSLFPTFIEKSENRVRV